MMPACSLVCVNILTGGAIAGDEMTSAEIAGDEMTGDEMAGDEMENEIRFHFS